MARVCPSMQAELAKSTALGTFMVIFTLFLPPMRNWPIWTFRESGNSNAAWAPPIAALLRFASALRQSGSRVTVAAFVVLSGLSCRDAGAYEGHTCSNGAYQYYSLWGPRPEFDKNWMPISNKNWMVTKWKQPIQIVFVDFTKGSARARELRDEVSAEAKKFADATALPINALVSDKPVTGNVVVFLSDDVLDTDLKSQDVLRNIYLSAGVRSDIDTILKLHHHGMEQMLYKCSGTIALNTTEGIVGAVLYLQTNQDKRCVPVALSAMLGIESDDPSLSMQSVPLTAADAESFEMKALSIAHEKYDSIFAHGMNDSEVRSIMAEHCR